MGALRGDSVTAERETASFAEFVAAVEPRLRRALTAGWGIELGREATAEALAWAWAHWPEVQTFDNPAGYLYRVGRDRARRLGRRPLLEFPSGVDAAMPWVEPGLPAALARLSHRQRVVVTLLYGYQWTMAEVAELLDISKGSVQIHERRGMARLRERLGVGT